ncbi:transcription factor Dp-1 [Thecamonas trahens ATCC 50062]|uniref:Transcription factor Dp-1 n=1 Tax=Thecamonas trahens ATCC 50062 TaxID=461836 RepID=A0A0L0DA69_THETB|nr:transcription factor Dp-1 [Thecamonas trahens ATCC 50062]KNC48986.1 transcription factor Dp-1 [Thecamonas trahens ATCC 50062]|eukprot:XP_013758401.1 transcription factor Dp-1 [Thecamonas trahens ATCC 50062]
MDSGADALLQTEMLDLIADSGLAELAKDSGLVSASGMLNTPGSSRGQSTQAQDPPASLDHINLPMLPPLGGLPGSPLVGSGKKRGREGEDEVRVGRGSLEEVATAALVASSRRASVASTPTPRRRKRSSSKAPGSTAKNAGLRHFSMRVCQKVRQKGQTTYDEVATELVNEIVAAEAAEGKTNSNQKNIRRRVYDALNVLMAMDIISREKKVISWLGLPSSEVGECDQVRKRIAARTASIAQKKHHLQELLTQVVTLNNLVERNTNRRRKLQRNLAGNAVASSIRSGGRSTVALDMGPLFASSPNESPVSSPRRSSRRRASSPVAEEPVAEKGGWRWLRTQRRLLTSSTPALRPKTMPSRTGSTSRSLSSTHHVTR